MKKYWCLLILCFISLWSNAQHKLKFDTRLLDCEDKWIALPMSKDSTYIFGFVYLDNTAGLTLHYGGTFKPNENNKLLIVKKEFKNKALKIRLTPRPIKVAIISDDDLKEMDMAKIPDWLSIYKSFGDSTDRMFRLGFTYNAWGESGKALQYLEKVKNVNPKYNGLDFELAFAFNALAQYDKAIEIIEEALKNKPDDCNLNKELVFALTKANQLDSSIQKIRNSLEACKNKEIRNEMLWNIIAYYFKKKDKEQFKTWSEKGEIEFSGHQKLLDKLAEMRRLLSL